MKHEKEETEKHHEKPPNQNDRQKHKEKETMEIKRNQKTKDKMAGLSPHLSILTLNANGLNSLIIGQRVAGWIKKQDPTICCLQETQLSSKDKQAQSEGMEDDTPSKWQPKEGGYN